MVSGVSFLNGTERFWLEKPEAVPFGLERWRDGVETERNCLIPLNREAKRSFFELYSFSLRIRQRLVLDIPSILAARVLFPSR